MKRLSLVVLVVSLLIMTSGASAFEFANVVGYWDVNSDWLDMGSDGVGDIPTGTQGGETKIRFDGTHCTVRTDTTVWKQDRLRVYNGGQMTIVSGASLNSAWFRSGTKEGPGTVTQTGGLVTLDVGTDSGKLTLGDQPSDPVSEGVYDISGGTVTHSGAEGIDGSIIVGYKGGSGRFIVRGTGPTVQMRKIYVGGNKSGYASVGTVEFHLIDCGVSPIELSSNIYLNRYGDGEAHLAVYGDCSECIDPGPPICADIVLLTDTGGGSIDGEFDDVTDILGTRAAGEGAYVYLTPAPECCCDPVCGDMPYCRYMLTYAYDAQSDGNTNDVALVFVECVPEPATVALFGLGLMITAVRRPRKK